MTMTSIPVRRRGGATRESAVSRTIAMAVMLVATLYFLTPLWWLFVAATKTRSDFTTTAPLWFADFALFDNVAALIGYRDGVFLRWLLNSALYAGVGALLATLIAAMAGYAIAKYTFRGRETLFNVVLGGVLVPATALALPLFLIFSQAGATNTIWAVLLPSLVSPFGVYLSRIYASASVPDEIIEAARIDGAGEVRRRFDRRAGYDDDGAASRRARHVCLVVRFVVFGFGFPPRGSLADGRPRSSAGSGRVLVAFDRQPLRHVGQQGADLGRRHRVAHPGPGECRVGDAEPTGDFAARVRPLATEGHQPRGRVGLQRLHGIPGDRRRAELVGRRRQEHAELVGRRLGAQQLLLRRFRLLAAVFARLVGHASRVRGCRVARV